MDVEEVVKQIMKETRQIRTRVDELLSISTEQQLTQQNLLLLRQDFEKTVSLNRVEHGKIFESLNKKIDRNGLVKVVGLMFTGMGLFFTFVGFLLYIFKVKL